MTAPARACSLLIAAGMAFSALACTKRPAASAAGTREPTRGSATLEPAEVLADASSATPRVAGAPWTCRTAGAVEIDNRALPGNIVVTDVVDLAAAAVEDDALVTFAVDGNHGCPYDGCEVYHEVFSFGLDRTLTPTKVTPVPNASLGVSPSADVAPFVMKGRVFAFSQGHAGAAPTGGPDLDAADTVYLLAGRTIVRRSVEKFTGAYAASGSGATAFALGTGREAAWHNNGGTPGAPSVRLFRILADATPHGELVVKSKLAPPGVDDPRYDAPAIHVVGMRVALAYRYRVSNTGARELWASWANAESGQLVGAPVQVARGDVGAANVLIVGDVMHVVFAQRDAVAAPYTLRHASWSAGAPAPGVVRELRTPTASALAPALVAQSGGGVALAFMVAPSEKAGSVWAGHGATLAEAAQSATRRSAENVHNARDPEWAGTGQRSLLVWTEHEETRRVRFATCGAPSAATALRTE